MYVYVHELKSAHKASLHIMFCFDFLSLWCIFSVGVASVLTKSDSSWSIITDYILFWFSFLVVHILCWCRFSLNKFRQLMKHHYRIYSLDFLFWWCIFSVGVALVVTYVWYIYSVEPWAKDNSDQRLLLFWDHFFSDLPFLFPHRWAPSPPPPPPPPPFYF